MSLIELNDLLNGDYKNSYHSGEYTTNILNRQYVFAEMFKHLIYEVELNGISSQFVCPDLKSYNTAAPSSEDFMIYNNELEKLKNEVVTFKSEPEVLDVGRSR